MRFALLALSALATTAMAWPAWPSLSLYPRQNSSCLTKAEAQLMVDVYARLISNYTDADCNKYWFPMR